MSRRTVSGGKPIDKLTNIWPFGWVLYEMLAGTPAFGDEDVCATLTMILEADPVSPALPPATPLRRCLDWNPSTRVQNIAKLERVGEDNCRVCSSRSPDRNALCLV
jgi:serine/threonine protein kinase